MKNFKDILYFSQTNWDSMKRRSQHLATELAKSNRVLYINPLYSAITYVKHIKNKNHRIPLTRKTKNLYILTPPPLLPRSEWYFLIQRINYFIFYFLIKYIIKRLKFNYSVLWIDFPRFIYLVEKFRNNTILCYDCRDNYPVLYPSNSKTRRLIESAEEKTFKLADVTFAVSNGLFAKCKKKTSNTYLIRNGVNVRDAFLVRRNNGTKSPAYLQKISHPIIGYTGTVGKWIDTELIKRVALSFPECSVVLVGPVHIDVSGLKKIENLYFLGERPYQEIFSYILAFDVCMVPFNLDSFTEEMDPIKLYEYFVFGKPVVVTKVLPQVGYYMKLCYISTDQENFLSNIKTALKESEEKELFKDIRKERFKVAMGSTWGKRAKEVSKILEDVAKGK